MKETWIAPSILSANFGNLLDDVKKVEQAGARLLHVDVMDGHFVPNITIGPLVVRALKNGGVGIPLDVHLMIENPDKYIGEFIKSGASYVTVHWETCSHLHGILQSIRMKGAKCGVAINPATPASFLYPVLKDVDLVLVMTVNPGFGGQEFISECLDKIDELNKVRKNAGHGFVIQVDGGVKQSNCAEIAQRGADILVAGSAVFHAPDPANAVKELISNSSG